MLSVALGDHDRPLSRLLDDVDEARLELDDVDLAGLAPHRPDRRGAGTAADSVGLKVAPGVARPSPRPSATAAGPSVSFHPAATAAPCS
ncbi:hypothetical protein O1L55_05890 [Streptomyces albulus]|nr:hypothetical protein [Streptomyces noursei]